MKDTIPVMFCKSIISICKKIADRVEKCSRGPVLEGSASSSSQNGLQKLYSSRSAFNFKLVEDISTQKSMGVLRS